MFDGDDDAIDITDSVKIDEIDAVLILRCDRFCQRIADDNLSDLILFEF